MEIGRVGQSYGSRSGLDTPNGNLTTEIGEERKNKKLNCGNLITVSRGVRGAVRCGFWLFLASHFVMRFS